MARVEHPEYGDPLRLLKWQPIETAPKDGCEVLLYVPYNYAGKNVVMGRWEGGRFCNQEDDWVDATDWMPLPDFLR
jgi:hypothetical protein